MTSIIRSCRKVIPSAATSCIACGAPGAHPPLFRIQFDQREAASPILQGGVRPTLNHGSYAASVLHSGYASGMPKKQRAVRIKEQDLERLKKLAKKEHETVSFLIQTAIREFLDRK